MLNSKTIINNPNSKLGNLYAVMHMGVIVNAIHSRAFLFGKNDMDKRFIRKNNDAPLCGCGCGKKVKRDYWDKKWNKYIKGHNKTNLGIRPSIETRQKLSIANMGHEVSIETRKKISISKIGKNKPMFGKITSKETRQKISIAEKGKIVSKETCLKISISHKGEKNPMYGRYGERNSNWKGGISCEPYCEIWTDEEYKQSIRDRDNNQCQNPYCKKNCNLNHKLSLHHINHIKKDCNPWNLISLCRGCNVRAENKKHKEHYEYLYREIMFKKYEYKYN